MKFFLSFFCFLLAAGVPARAKDMPVSESEPTIVSADSCRSDDRPCLLKKIGDLATKITEDRWRDLTYRELAKTLAFDGQTDQAIALLEKIREPDTRAMTIRGIGMTVAGRNLSEQARKAIYNALESEARKIEHAPSRAIAFTYISMAQAFAGDDALALETAAGMDNDSLKNKAFGEAAEIQAERGKTKTALDTLARIPNMSYRDKQGLIVLKILANAARYDDALSVANSIRNPVLQSEGIQFLLDARTPRDLEKETRRGLPVREQTNSFPDPHRKGTAP